MARPLSLLLGLVALSVLGCLAESGRPEALAQATEAVGEPMRTDAGLLFPDWEERVLFVLTNRARSDPQRQQAECTPGAYKACPWPEAADGGCYTPKPPVVWDLTASRASRFHATYLSKSPCALGHDSCCSLRTDVDATGCDGDPSCACVAGTQSCDCTNGCTGASSTAFNTRTSRFGFSASGEIAHQYYTDPLAIFHGWVDESLGTPSSSCAYSGSNGHRWLILNSAGPRVGVGHFQGSGCNSPYWVQDFGGASVAIPRVPGGIHYPRSGTTSTRFTFWANYHHQGGGAPSLAAVVVNGTCRTLALEFGAANSGTYRYDGTLPSGCQPYYFLFTDSAGARTTFPTAGSLAVGVGSTCPNEYVATQLPASCDPSDGGTPPGPDAGQDGGTRPDGGSGSSDSGTSPGSDGGGGGGSGDGGSSGSDDGGLLPDGGTGGPGPGGCGCTSGGFTISVAAVALLALIGRRRVHRAPRRI